MVRAAAFLRGARVGMMGYRDMKLYATLVDGVSLRRVVGAEVEAFETLEVAQRMPCRMRVRLRRSRRGSRRNGKATNL